VTLKNKRSSCSRIPLRFSILFFVLFDPVHFFADMPGPLPPDEDSQQSSASAFSLSDLVHDFSSDESLAMSDVVLASDLFSAENESSSRHSDIADDETFSSSRHSFSLSDLGDGSDSLSLSDVVLRSASHGGENSQQSLTSIDPRMPVSESATDFRHFLHHDDSRHAFSSASSSVSGAIQFAIPRAGHESKVDVHDEDSRASNLSVASSFDSKFSDDGNDFRSLVLEAVATLLDEGAHDFVDSYPARCSFIPPVPSPA
jgi:hypothetical protein